MNNSIYLIRHGQTDWNLAGRWQGRTDIPLNGTGKAQAAAIAKRLSTRPIAAIYSSHLLRASETAQAIARHHDLMVQFEPDLQERSAGDLEGLTREDVRLRYPETHAAMHRGLFLPPNGETMAQTQARALPIFERVLAAHPDESVVVVSHGGTIATLIAHQLGMPLEESYRFSLYANCALTRLEQTDRGLRLMQLNDTGHLES